MRRSAPDPLRRPHRSSSNIGSFGGAGPRKAFDGGLQAEMRTVSPSARRQHHQSTAVASNVAQANTAALALKVADVLAEQK